MECSQDVFVDKQIGALSSQFGSLSKVIATALYRLYMV